jgi:hypothetical protein
VSEVVVEKGFDEVEPLVNRCLLDWISQREAVKAIDSGSERHKIWDRTFLLVYNCIIEFDLIVLYFNVTHMFSY